MWRNRLWYLTAILACLLLLFFFDGALFLWVAGILALLVPVLRLFIRSDVRKLSVQGKLPAYAFTGQPLALRLRTVSEKKLYTVGNVFADLEITCIMTGKIQKRSLCLAVSDAGKEFAVRLDSDCCGEIRVRCTGLWVMDVMKLFRLPGENFREVRTMIYPERIRLQVGLVKGRSGMPEQEGILQNRRGTDRSEVFDTREYIPGDDLRSVHWKLSEKVGKLLIRESSDPSHYDLLLLPDVGRNQKEIPVAQAEQNAAAAACESAGRELCQQGISFCLAVLSEEGLHLLEVRSPRELDLAMQEWMSTRMPEQSGTALKYFLLEHLERHFSRLLIISAGRYRESLQELEGRIGFTAVSCVEGKKTVYSALGEQENMVEIPVPVPKDEVYRILC